MAYHIDYETSSGCDLDFGAYRYACDPTTRILLFAIAKDDGEVLLWDFKDPHCDESLAAEAMWREACDPNNQEPIYAHNAQFELAQTTCRAEPDLGIAPPDINRWRCTMAMCRRAAAPESLAEAAKFFGLDAKKDAIGKKLIEIFSDQTKATSLLPPPGMIDPATRKPLKKGGFTKGSKPKNRKSFSPILEDEVLWDWLLVIDDKTYTVRQAWEMFKEYCRQDVRVEQQLHAKLHHFELKGDILESFLFDLRMNWRGVPVNVSALENAVNLLKPLAEKMTFRFSQMCGLLPSQNAKLKEWFVARGYPADNLQAGTIEEVLESPPPEMTPLALETLHMKSLLSFSALAKIPKMYGSVCPDGRIRGTMQWHAARTGRAGGRIIQPQNFKKPSKKIGDTTHLCYRMIRENWEPQWFEELWSSPLDAFASSIRHFIQPHEGMVLDGDYVGVEARITPWLVGDQKKLDFILNDGRLYERMAAAIFKVGIDEIYKGDPRRTIAKPAELGCCFGVGYKGLMEGLAKPPYNTVITKEEAEMIVEAYRDLHPETTAAWKEIEDAMKAAIRTPGSKHSACHGKLQFSCGRVAGITYAAIRLPSGRRLYYPHAEIVREYKKYTEEEMEESYWKRERGGRWTEQIAFVGKIQQSNKYGRIRTWGSRLFENCVQAIGVDLLTRGCIEAERRGFPVFMIIHDQALCESAFSKGTLNEFLEAMKTKDDWAETFPLDTAGGEHPYYLKDD